MTNWCKNILVVTGDEKHVARFKTLAVGFWPWDEPVPGEEPGALNFHSLVPIPDQVIAAGYKDGGKDWQKKNWGCAGGAVLPRLESENSFRLDYFFETPISPPLKWMQKVSASWPLLLFELSFLEEMLSYRGEATARAGKLTSKVDTEFGNTVESGGVKL